MDEFLHLYEMESLSLGITARKDVIEQIRRFFSAREDKLGVPQGMHRMAEAMAARHEAKSEAKGDEDGIDMTVEGEGWSLVVAGNTKECFRNRLRNIQLVALSTAITRAPLVGIRTIDFRHNYLGDEHDMAASSSKDAKHGDTEEKKTEEEEHETAFLLDAAPALARLLQSTTLYTSTIEELNLSGNRFGAESCKLLCAQLQGSTSTRLRRLNLSGNPLRVSGGHALADWLASPTCTLTELDVGDTELEVENLVAIATALRENRSLISLNLDKPVIRTKEEEAIQHIGKMLQVNETLRALSLNNHHLTDHGAQVLAERLLDNHTLQRLTLRGNNIGATGAQALGALLLRHDALAEFDLSANRIGDVGAAAFAKVLRHNTRPLSILALCSTYLTDDGLALIAEACQAPRHPGTNHLRSLLLWGNDFGDRSAALFLELHDGRFQEMDIETDFLPTRGDGHVQIAHRQVLYAVQFASPKR